jgi:hypothetical protein
MERIAKLKKESDQDYELFLLYLNSDNKNIGDIYIEWCQRENEFYDEEVLQEWYLIAQKNQWENRLFEHRIRQEEIGELELLEKFKNDMLLITFQARQQSIENLNQNKELLNKFYESTQNTPIGDVDSQQLKNLSSVYANSVKDIKDNFELSSDVLGLKTVIEQFMNNQQLTDVSDNGILEGSVQNVELLEENE